MDSKSRSFHFDCSKPPFSSELKKIPSTQLKRLSNVPLKERLACTLLSLLSSFITILELIEIQFRESGTFRVRWDQSG